MVKKRLWVLSPNCIYLNKVVNSFFLFLDTPLTYNITVIFKSDDQNLLWNMCYKEFRSVLGFKRQTQRLLVLALPRLFQSCLLSWAETIMRPSLGSFLRRVLSVGSVVAFIILILFYFENHGVQIFMYYRLYLISKH